MGTMRGVVMPDAISQDPKAKGIRDRSHGVGSDDGESFPFRVHLIGRDTNKNPNIASVGVVVLQLTKCIHSN